MERARITLGIDDETAFDMHVSAFNEEVRELLGLKAAEGDEETVVDLGEAKFSEGAQERVSGLSFFSQQIFCSKSIFLTLAFFSVGSTIRNSWYLRR